MILFIVTHSRSCGTRPPFPSSVSPDPGCSSFSSAQESPARSPPGVQGHGSSSQGQQSVASPGPTYLTGRK